MVIIADVTNAFKILITMTKHKKIIMTKLFWWWVSLLKTPIDKTNDYNDYDNDCDEECLFLAEES